MAGKWEMAKATSKKLANAFGKAVQHPEATPEGRKLVYESKTIKNMPGDYAPTKQDTPAQRAFKAGRYQGDENYELSRDAIDTRYDGDDRDVRKAVAGQEVDAMEDFNSDYRLKEDFDKALDEAAENHGYKKWREESKDMPANDGFGGSLHDVNREDAVQRSREEIIKALQQNTDRDVTDVLRDFGYIFEE
jgi:hypothetical protein